MKSGVFIFFSSGISQLIISLQPDSSKKQAQLPAGVENLRSTLCKPLPIAGMWLFLLERSVNQPLDKVF